MKALEQLFAALAPWVRKLRIAGVGTARVHPLQDHPAVRWQGFGQVRPDDMSGQTMLAVGCTAGFHAIDLARRTADRALAIDSDPRYLRQMCACDVAQPDEMVDLLILLRVFQHLRHPRLAVKLLWDHVADDRHLVQSMHRGAGFAVAAHPETGG
ncbi:hypothetical protein [Frigidibacter sp. SD6-1]|uniref:hypothetical protein n=1 Tax=Frigidibacter sp. SD6-1 TaxID=3032581 RepID=UPI0024E01607|nr:hypothetical protein [Frigidibacter sp. SD6-1]